MAQSLAFGRPVTPLELDATGTVRLASTSPLFPLPEGPKHAAPTAAAMTPAFFISVATLFGAIVGSFLQRLHLPRVAAWAVDRVSCLGIAESGQRELSWYEEHVPIVGWLALGAKCRTCKTPLSFFAIR